MFPPMMGNSLRGGEKWEEEFGFKDKMSDSMFTIFALMGKENALFCTFNCLDDLFECICTHISCLRTYTLTQGSIPTSDKKDDHS